VPQPWRLPICYAISLVLIVTTLASTFGRNAGFSAALIAILASPLVLLLPGTDSRERRESPSNEPLVTHTADASHTAPLKARSAHPITRPRGHAALAATAERAPSSRASSLRPSLQPVADPVPPFPRRPHARAAAAEPRAPWSRRRRARW
jgi:hypothetical protein